MAICDRPTRPRGFELSPSSSRAQPLELSRYQAERSPSSSAPGPRAQPPMAITPGPRALELSSSAPQPLELTRLRWRSMRPACLPSVSPLIIGRSPASAQPAAIAPAASSRPNPGRLPLPVSCALGSDRLLPLCFSPVSPLRLSSGERVDGSAAAERIGPQGPPEPSAVLPRGRRRRGSQI